MSKLSKAGNSHSVVTKKPTGVTLRDTSKIQLIQRQNSQKSGLQLNNQNPNHQSGLLSHRSSNRGTHQHKQPQLLNNVDQQSVGASRNSIIATMRRQQITSKEELAAMSGGSCLRDFHVHKKIGTGAYSEVFLVTRNSDGMEYALKQVKIQRLTEKEKENALNEVRILASINNPNVIAYKDAFFDEDSSTLCIVMEFAGMGDLYEKIMEHQKSATEFVEREIWEALIQMTTGLKALHDRNIFHRDLKSANIFQSTDGTFKMGDLNVSKIAQDGMLYTQTGTPYYASPEVWQEKPYDKKSDIWSLGCIMYEMCSLNPPFRAKSMKGLYNSVLSGMYPKLPQHYSTQLSSIIKALLAVNPAKRPSCEQLLQNDSILDFLNSRQSTFNEPLNDQDNSQIQDVLLKTIHCPRNLSQLSQILPRSKYQSVASGGLAQSISSIQHQQNKNIANAVNNNNGNLPIFELPAQIQVPHTAATDERKGKRRKNTNTTDMTAQSQAAQSSQTAAATGLQPMTQQCPSAQVGGDRNHIIEMAQQIILPPIRESGDGGTAHPTMLQLQQQRQKELLGIRRKTNASNRSKMTIEAQNENRQRPNQKTKKELDHQQQQQIQIMEEETQKEKKKIKSQLQIRQQIGRVAQKELKNMKKQSESSQNLLMNYPMDVANTLAAQNLQCMENYAVSGSMIELPPSISNIYATATATNDVQNSRFNINNVQRDQPQYSISKECSQPNSSRRIEEKMGMNQSLNMVNQPITINDLSHKQKLFQNKKQQMQSQQRNTNSQPRLQQIIENRQSINLNSQQQQAVQQQVYASQTNLMSAASSKQSNQKDTPSRPAGHASAHRYQSVGMNREKEERAGTTAQTTGSGSINATPNEGQQQIQTGSGSTSLPGLKLNLQTMKSAKQLQKFTPSDTLMNSMKIRQSIKQQQALDQKDIMPPQMEKSNSNANLRSLAPSQEQQQYQSSKLPPRQHSTTRNGHGPTQRSQVQQKQLAKQAINSGHVGQLPVSNLSHRSIQKKNGLISQSQQRVQLSEQQQEVSSTLATNAKASIQQASSPQIMTGNSKVPSANQMTPADRKGHGSLPATAFVKQRQKMHTASQSHLKEIDSYSNTLLMKNVGNSAAQPNQYQQVSDSLTKNQQKALRNQASSSSITNRAQMKAVNRDKSEIMVELMPLQGNSGRVNAKVNLGRNNGQFSENFNQKMEQRTTEQESLRLLQKNTGDQIGIRSNTMIVPVVPKIEKAVSGIGPKIKKQPQVQDDDEEVYTDPELTAEKVVQQESSNGLQEKKSQLKQLRMQQKSILNKKARKQTQQNISPLHHHQFTRAQYNIEMPPHNRTSIGNSSIVDQQLPPPDVNSFEIPKNSHRLLPAPKLETQHHKKQSQNSGGPGHNKTNIGSSKILPNLKTYLDDNDNISSNNQRNNANLGSAATGHIIETQQFERSKQIMKEAGGPPSTTKLEKNKQYLEQLRQLASIRHQKKKQADIKTQLSVQTKKNGGSKAAELMGSGSGQSGHSSPLSGKIASTYSNCNMRDSSSVQQSMPSQIHPFNARSSLPHLPSCHDGARGSYTNNNNASNGHYDQAN